MFANYFWLKDISGILLTSSLNSDYFWAAAFAFQTKMSGGERCLFSWCPVPSSSVQHRERRKNCPTTLSVTLMYLRGHLPYEPKLPGRGSRNKLLFLSIPNSMRVELGRREEKIPKLYNKLLKWSVSEGYYISAKREGGVKR